MRSVGLADRIRVCSYRRKSDVLKRKVTSIAVDFARDYLRDRLKELKQLDLDKDGQKDIDQMATLLSGISEKVKDCLDSTDFQKLAGGLEQIMSGVKVVSALG